MVKRGNLTDQFKAKVAPEVLPQSVWWVLSDELG